MKWQPNTSNARMSPLLNPKLLNLKSEEKITPSPQAWLKAEAYLASSLHFFLAQTAENIAEKSASVEHWYKSQTSPHFFSLCF